MNKIEEFWDWFSANASRYEKLNIVDAELRDGLLGDFEEHLHNYCNKIFFEIGGAPGKINELIITAEGDVNYFETVDKLIEGAPVISNWMFIPLKPQVKGHFETIWEGVKINTNNIYFNPSNNSDTSGVSIIVYISDYNSNQGDQYYSGLFKMLDTILGERSFALDIKSVNIKSHHWSKFPAST